MREVVITSAVRTPIGTFEGALSTVPVTELGSIVVKEALRRSGVAPDEVSEVIMGHVLQAGAGSNTARQVLLMSGLPNEVPAFTVNMVCASGMKAISLAAMSIATGDREIVVAGGMENMSAAPYLLAKAREGYRLGNGELLDCLLRDALSDPLDGCHMGITAENVAAAYQISRQDQDEFAALSQNKASVAQDSGKFDAEIVPVEVALRKRTLAFEKDAFPRPDTTAEVLSGLKPAFKKDGTVTAGNSSGINDGAAALVLMTADEANRRGIQPLGTLLASASTGVDPMLMGIGPVGATRAVLEKAGIGIDRVDMVELNEAFAAQSLAVIRDLGLNIDITNVHGGAIALGHPVGASGARIVVTLLYAMADRDARMGLATLCVGGGQGMAMLIER